MEFNIDTRMKTVKKALRYLRDELNIDILGNTIDEQSFISSVFLDDKFCGFLKIITGRDDVDFDELTAREQFALFYSFSDSLKKSLVMGQE